MPRYLATPENDFHQQLPEMESLQFDHEGDTSTAMLAFYAFALSFWADHQVYIGSEKVVVKNSRAVNYKIRPYFSNNNDYTDISELIAEF